MTDFLCHYYDDSTGPFRNLSDLDLQEAERVLSDIRFQRKGLASQRSLDYMATRFELEDLARAMFIGKGGRPIRRRPHYMTFRSVRWLLDWYPNGRELRIPISAFNTVAISFTYGDLFPTMRFNDDRPYRRQLYTIDEIYGVISSHGLPQDWNRNGDWGPERYIEVQIWDDSALHSCFVT